jgi:hypothetical protein
MNRRFTQPYDTCLPAVIGFALMAVAAIFLLIVLASCAATYVAPPQDDEAADVYIKYGLGGVVFGYNLGPGSGTLGDQIQSKYGSRVRIAGYFQFQDQLYQTINKTPARIKIIIIGNSCGAVTAPFDAAQSSRQIDAVMGIQPSTDGCEGDFSGTNPIPSNVRFALDTYNPSCPETLGLGCQLYTASPPTQLTIVQRPDLHPALSQDSFNDVLSEMNVVMSASAKLGAPHGGTKLIVRYHQQKM